MAAMTAHPDPAADVSVSLELALGHLHQRVHLRFDRPAGSHHPVHGFRYPVNYGYVPGTLAPDGDELDGYYLGTGQPLEHADGVVAVIHRLGDDDDKLVVVTDTAVSVTDAEIAAQVEFQERPGHYRSCATRPRRTPRSPLTCGGSRRFHRGRHAHRGRGHCSPRAVGGGHLLGGEGTPPAARISATASSRSALGRVSRFGCGGLGL